MHPNLWLYTVITLKRSTNASAPLLFSLKYSFPLCHTSPVDYVPFFLTKWPLFKSQPILTRDAELTCKARNVLPLCFPKSNCLPRINTTNALCTLRLPTAWSYHEVHFRRIQFPFGLDHTAKHVRSRLFACTQKSKRFPTEWKAKTHRSFTCYNCLIMSRTR